MVPTLIYLKIIIIVKYKSYSSKTALSHKPRMQISHIAKYFATEGPVRVANSTPSYLRMTSSFVTLFPDWSIWINSPCLSTGRPVLIGSGIIPFACLLLAEVWSHFYFKQYGVVGIIFRGCFAFCIHLLLCGCSFDMEFLRLMCAVRYSLILSEMWHQPLITNSILEQKFKKFRKFNIY